MSRKISTRPAKKGGGDIIKIENLTVELQEVILLCCCLNDVERVSLVSRTWHNIIEKFFVSSCSAQGTKWSFREYPYNPGTFPPALILKDSTQMFRPKNQIEFTDGTYSSDSKWFQRKRSLLLVYNGGFSRYNGKIVFDDRARLKEFTGDFSGAILKGNARNAWESWDFHALPIQK